MKRTAARTPSWRTQARHPRLGRVRGEQRRGWPAVAGHDGGGVIGPPRQNENCWLFALLAAMLLWPLLAIAGEPAEIGVRAGNHPGFGRVVFDVPPGTHYRLARDGDRITVRFVPELPVADASALPRNVRSVRGGAHEAVVTLAPGATAHDMRLGNHIVIDVFDPKDAASAGDSPIAGRATPTQARRSRPEPKPRRTDAAPGAAAAPNDAGSAARPVRGPAAGKPDRDAPHAAQAASTAAKAPASPPVTPAPSAPVQPGPDSGRTTTGGPVPGSAEPPPAASNNMAEHPPEPATHAAAQAFRDVTAPIAEVADGAAAPAQAAAVYPVEAGAEPGKSGRLASGDPVVSGGPLGLVATLVPPPFGTQGVAFLLPFPDGVGAAAFRREDTDYLIFDESRPLDLGALRRDKLPWRTSVHLLPAATLVRLRLPPGLSVALNPTPQGWIVAILTGAPPPRPIGEHLVGNHFQLAADAPGRVVTIADPETGATLLVGTQRQPGQAVAIRRSGPEFSLLPSWQGVLVEALSDRLVLRAEPGGFALSAEPDGLAVSPLTDDALTDAAALTRRFQFSMLPTEMLRQRVTFGLAEAAAAPPLARGPRRRAIARDMLALGMAAEAQALLRVAAEEDPNAAAEPDTAGLAGIAALLAGRTGDADGITDPRLNGTDEIAFWRAVRLAQQNEASPEAASVFAVTGPLALGYPAAMRDKLLPTVLETMLRGGQAAVAEALLARCGEQPGLDMARAMATEAAGKVDAALAAYDALAQGADQRASARAVVRALQLRLAQGRITVRQAADGLDRQLYAWRGDRRDLAVRERLASLRQQSGEWRSALTVLRDAEPDFPAAKAEIHARMQEIFAALLRGNAADRLSPIELVALVDENADLLPPSAEGERLQARLADRLLALDLPNQAGPVLEKLMRAAPSATGRAGFGARLAGLRLREGDAAGALNALIDSAATALPAPLAERRKLLFAAATARRGDFSAALAAIADLDSAAAAAERAEVSEQAQDWWGADRALADYVTKTVPPSGTLDDAQRRALLRLATAAARAGDEATLRRLNAGESVRMSGGPLGDMFDLLTAAPVRTTSDLRRARQEVGLARALPAALKALQSP